MDNKSSKSTNRTNSSISSPMSAEEKLKKSMRGLSHMGGSSGLNLDSSSRVDTKTKSSSSSRKKVGGVVLDLETIQDATKQKLQTKGRRNNVIILVLGLLLVVSLVYLAIAIVGYYNSKKDPNCKYSIQGDVDAKWIIDGQSKTQFLIPDNLGADTVYVIDSRLEINTTAELTLVIEIKALFNGKEILIGGLQEADNFERESKTNLFKYNGTIVGGGTIEVFKGIDFRDVDPNLNGEDVTIEVIAHFERV
ncbi:MAG: hypothetical protein IJ458_02415 [Clostridia bacterium]|nr:hypothetical protein [Clostridia bacterium]